MSALHHARSRARAARTLLREWGELEPQSVESRLFARQAVEAVNLALALLEHAEHEQGQHVAQLRRARRAQARRARAA